MHTPTTVSVTILHIVPTVHTVTKSLVITTHFRFTLIHILHFAIT